MITRTRLSRWFLAAAVGLSSAVGIGNLAGWIPEMTRALRMGTVNGVIGGGDFAMFRAAAELASEGRWTDVYSLEGLAESMSAVFGGVSFAYPPPFAMLIQPLTHLSYPLALTLWLAVGILGVLLFAARQPRTGVLGLGAMLFPIYVSLRFGQFVPVAVLALALTGWSLERERSFIAGLCLGLLVLKPQFLLGPVLVAISQHRRYPKLLSGTLTSSITLVAGSLLLDFGAWRAFVAGFGDLAAPGVATRWNFSLLSMTTALPGSLDVIAASVIALTVTVLTVRLARQAIDEEEMIALGLVLSLLVSPRLVVYDWALLLVAFAWIGRNVEEHSPLVFFGGLLALASLSGHLSVSWLAWLTLAASVFAATVLGGSHLARARVEAPSATA